MSQRDDELKTMLAAVDQLAAEMKDKLREKAAQGYSGGLDPAYADNVRASLKRHVVRLTTACRRASRSKAHYDIGDS